MARPVDTAWQKAIIASLAVCLSSIVPTFAQVGLKTNRGRPDLSSNQERWAGVGTGFRPDPHLRPWVKEQSLLRSLLSINIRSSC
jgi:hypothetical protein